VNRRIQYLLVSNLAIWSVFVEGLELNNYIKYSHGQSEGQHCTTRAVLKVYPASACLQARMLRNKLQSNEVDTKKNRAMQWISAILVESVVIQQSRVANTVIIEIIIDLKSYHETPVESAVTIQVDDLDQCSIVY